MNFRTWEAEVTEDIRQDALWKVEAYRLGLFVADIGWHDVTKLMQDRRTLALSDQLYRALGSISANIAEGYSRSTGKDRARFLEYALGSARESRDWYHKGRYILGQEISYHRIKLLTSIIRLLIKMIPQQRTHSIRELEIGYQTGTNQQKSDEDFLQNVPLP
jgi:four helix bundle protein